MAGSDGSPESGWMLGLVIGLPAVLFCLVCVGWFEYSAYYERKRASEKQKTPASGAILHVDMLDGYRLVSGV
jgi:hypothetical protein